jgi:hypothetical protein
MSKTTLAGVVLALSQAGKVALPPELHVFVDALAAGAAMLLGYHAADK